MLILLTLEGMSKIVLTDEEMLCMDLNAINYEFSCASAYSYDILNFWALFSHDILIKYILIKRKACITFSLFTHFSLFF